MLSFLSEPDKLSGLRQKLCTDAGKATVSTVADLGKEMQQGVQSIEDVPIAIFNMLVNLMDSSDMTDKLEAGLAVAEAIVEHGE